MKHESAWSLEAAPSSGLHLHLVFFDIIGHLLAVQDLGSASTFLNSGSSGQNQNSLLFQLRVVWGDLIFSPSGPVGSGDTIDKLEYCNIVGLLRLGPWGRFFFGITLLTQRAECLGRKSGGPLNNL